MLRHGCHHPFHIHLVSSKNWYFIYRIRACILTKWNLKFQNLYSDDDDNDEFEEGDDLDPAHVSGSPPALPPKRNLRKPPTFLPSSSHQNLSSSGDRIIPIVKESDGSIIICNRRLDIDRPGYPMLPPRRGDDTENPSDSTIRSSEVEAIEQSAASSTTTTSGLGTSTTGDQSCLASDDAITQNRYKEPA